MCIIFQREPNFEINKEAWDSAVLNNPDGWGISVANGDGSLLTMRSDLTADDDLYEMLHDEFLENKVMIHLRYTTAGATSLRNAHPFPILEREVDGVDLRMAHNGTISAYKPGFKDDNAWESDTRVFVRTYVRPLFKRLIKGMDIEDILTDPFVYDLLDSKLSTLSVLSFIDGFGNTLEVNPLGNGGKYSEGLWYSNEYSFDPLHRKPTYSNWGQQGWGYGRTYGDDGYDDWMYNPRKDAPGNGTTTPTTGSCSSGSLAGVDNKIGEDMQQKLFTEEYDVDVDDLFDLTDDTIDTMCVDDPSMSASLIRELLYRLQNAYEDCNKAEAKHKKAEEACEKMAAKLKKENTDEVA